MKRFEEGFAKRNIVPKFSTKIRWKNRQEYSIEPPMECSMTWHVFFGTAGGGGAVGGLVLSLHVAFCAAGIEPETRCLCLCLPCEPLLIQHFFLSHPTLSRSVPVLTCACVQVCVSAFVRACLCPSVPVRRIRPEPATRVVDAVCTALCWRLHNDAAAMWTAMCVHMRLNMCVDMCIDTCVAMCVGLCGDMCVDMCVGVLWRHVLKTCVRTRVQTFVWTCLHVGEAPMCTGHVHGHGSRHVRGRWCSHVHGHACTLA